MVFLFLTLIIFNAPIVFKNYKKKIFKKGGQVDVRGDDDTTKKKIKRKRG